MPDIVTDVSATGESSAPESNADVNAAGSSPAEADNTPSFEDVISKALGEETPATSEKEPDAEASDPKSQEDDPSKVEELPDDPTDDELKDAKPRTRERIERLLEQRRELRSENDGLKPKAAQWDQIEQFRQANGMKPEAVANAIQIAALIDNDPSRAIELLAPVWQSLQQRAGETLPDDLEQAVRRGEITRAHAQRIARSEAGRQNLEAQQQREREQRTRQAAQRETEQKIGTLAQASSTWDQEQAARDPDWSLKRDMVANVTRGMLQARVPDTQEGMRKLLDEAKKQVDGLLGNFRQPKPPVARDPDGASPRGAKPREPKDHYELVDQALGNI